MTAAPGPADLALAIDAGSHGPREVEHLLAAVVGALHRDPPPTSTSTHVVLADSVHHVAALVWRRATRTAAPWADLARLGLPDGTSAAWSSRTRKDGWEADGPQESAAVVAARQALSRSQGRVVTFAGGDDVPLRPTVHELLTGTAIDAVVGLAGIDVRLDDVVDAAGWLRPRWSDGDLELLVERAAGGVLRPFEVREQIACCAMH